MAATVTLVVAAALVDQAGQVLIARRPPGKAMAGLWEFPGGKCHADESPEQALIRELHEELGIAVESRFLQPLTFASHAYDGFHLLMPLWLCRHWSGEVSALEHEALAWLLPEKLPDYPMPPADLPLISALQDALAERG